MSPAMLHTFCGSAFFNLSPAGHQPTSGAVNGRHSQGGMNALEGYHSRSKHDLLLIEFISRMWALLSFDCEPNQLKIVSKKKACPLRQLIIQVKAEKYSPT